VVDGRSNIYLNSINFEFLAGARPTSGLIVLVIPDGSTRQVASDLAFPNTMLFSRVSAGAAQAGAPGRTTRAWPPPPVARFAACGSREQAAFPAVYQ
jgi:sugar lactone lactonase YvrE